jgi:hypothetical protein
MPQGYGQPPYGAPGQPQHYQPPTELDPNTGQPMVHAMDAANAYQGGKGVAAAQVCPECGGPMMPTNATNESRVLNTKTGEFAYPAGHCTNCGYNGITRPGESTGALAGAANGVRVNVVGTVAAPGGEVASAGRRTARDAEPLRPEARLMPKSRNRKGRKPFRPRARFAWGADPLETFHRIGRGQLDADEDEAACLLLLKEMGDYDPKVMEGLCAAAGLSEPTDYNGPHPRHR